MEFSRVVTPSLLGSMVTLTVASSSLSHELNGSDGSASSFLPEEPHKFQSSPTTTVPTLGYATVTYDGMIGVNATDPYAFTTETRSFILPVEIQVTKQIQSDCLNCLLTKTNLTGACPDPYVPILWNTSSHGHHLKYDCLLHSSKQPEDANGN